MKYINILLIFIIFGCYSGFHKLELKFTDESTPTCHTNTSAHKAKIKVTKINFQYNNNQEVQSCCIDAVTNQIDYESINPNFCASKIYYSNLNNRIKYNSNIKEDNLHNHSPPKIFLSKTSFLI